MSGAYVEKSRHDLEAAVLGIHATEAAGTEARAPAFYSMPDLRKASLLLFLSGTLAGVLSILFKRGLIPITVKDMLVGGYYVLGFGGAMYLAGGMTFRRASAVLGNTAVFLLWNYCFFVRPAVDMLILPLEMWLLVFWMVRERELMERIGLGARNFVRQFAAGLAAAVIFTAYFAWSLTNFGFSLKLDVWNVAVNTAQVIPMYLSIFCIMYYVWQRMKSIGMPPAGILGGLLLMSVSLNAPVFVMVGIAAKIPLSTSAAGFATVTSLMVISNYLTFNKFRSVFPAALFFTSLAALLLVSGLT